MTLNGYVSFRIIILAILLAAHVVAFFYLVRRKTKQR